MKCWENETDLLVTVVSNLQRYCVAPYVDKGKGHHCVSCKGKAHHCVSCKGKGHCCVSWQHSQYSQPAAKKFGAN